MNLKRLRGIATVALITIAAALFAGCMNSMAGSVDSSSRMATLQLSATGIPDEYAKEFAAYCEKQQRAASRSILPDDPYEIGKGTGQSAGLKYVLTGKSETGMTYGPEDVTLVGTATTGVYDFGDTVALDAMSWNLVLTAYSDAAKTKSVLVGYCSVDLRNGSGTATFVMGIAGLDTSGSVTLKGDIVDESDASLCYTAGIYRKDNLKDVGTTETSGTLTTNSGVNEEFTFTASDVSPGTYLYIMKFYKDSTKKNIVGSFTDTIVINPGNALKKENLVIDVIGKKPTAPKDLKAYLVDNSESSTGDTYNVKVTWTQSEYATNYELNVVESTGDGSSDLTPNATTGLIENGQIYGMASMDDSTDDLDSKIVKDFPGSAVFGKDSSSMMYGDSSCVLKLETGKVYEIQLRARNYIGVSDWENREAGGTETGCTAYAAPTSQRINRLLVTYKLNDALLTKEGAPNSVEDIYTEYKSWTENDELLVIAPSAQANGNKLSNDGAEFAAWLLDSGTGVKDLDDATSVTTTVGDAVKGYTYKNVTVIASFGNKVTGAVSQEEKMKDIDPTDIKVMYGLKDNIATNITGTNNSYAIPQSIGARYWIQITLDDTGTKYTNVKFEVWSQTNATHKTVSQTNVPGQCQINTGLYSAGKVYVMVTADTENAKGMSQTLTFDVK